MENTHHEKERIGSFSRSFHNVESQSFSSSSKKKTTFPYHSSRVEVLVVGLYHREGVLGLFVFSIGKGHKESNQTISIQLQSPQEES